MSSHQLVHRHQQGRLLLASVVIAIGGLPALQAQDPNAGVSASPTILARSPFLPPGWAPPESRRPQAPAKQASAGYEFRGVYKLGGQYRFLVSEPRSRSGSWVELGKSYEGYEVREYDPQSDTLTLFFDDKETAVKLADLDSNPTPMPVSGQAAVAEQKARDNSNRPVRRTIRPASRNTEEGSRERSSAPPPPAWLQKLREEAASRRAQAVGASGGPGGSPTGPVSASGAPGMTPPPPPDFTPPSPPPNLSEIDIPPPPTQLPPPPPPEIMEKIQQSISGRVPGT